MTSLKTKVDKLDVDKLKTVPGGLRKLSKVKDNNLVKKNVYDQLVMKVNATGTKIPATSLLITKTQYDSGKKGLGKKIVDIDKKIPNTSGLVKKTDCNSKITEIENKIPSITGLVTTVTLNTKATEIPDIRT